MAVTLPQFTTATAPPARPPRVLRPYVTWRRVANGTIEQLLDVQAWCLDVERTTTRMQAALRDSRRHDAVHDRHLALALATADDVTAIEIRRAIAADDHEDVQIDAVLALVAVPLVVAARIRWMARGLCMALERAITERAR